MPLTEDFTVPNLADGVPTQLTQMRDNWFFLLAAAARKAKAIAGWTTVITSNSSPVDYTKPDQMTLTKGIWTIQFDYTWTGSNLTQIVVSFADGASSPNTPVTITGGTLTLTYDGNGNFTGATSA